MTFSISGLEDARVSELREDHAGEECLRHVLLQRQPRLRLVQAHLRLHQPAGLIAERDGRRRREREEARERERNIY